MSEETLFRNKGGKWITKSLFYEYSTAKEYAIYTIKPEDIEVDGKTYVSLRSLFVHCEDPTEYEFANKFLGGWAHWKELQSTEVLKPLIEEWREERDVRFRSKGVKRLVDMAEAEDASFQAAKWLADKGWVEEKRGRPSKADIKKAAKEEAGIKKRTGSDLARIRGL